MKKQLLLLASAALLTATAASAKTVYFVPPSNFTSVYCKWDDNHGEKGLQLTTPAATLDGLGKVYKQDVDNSTWCLFNNNDWGDSNQTINFTPSEGALYYHREGTAPFTVSEVNGELVPSTYVQIAGTLQNGDKSWTPENMTPSAGLKYVYKADNSKEKQFKIVLPDNQWKGATDVDLDSSSDYTLADGGGNDHNILIKKDNNVVTDPVEITVTYQPYSSKNWKVSVKSLKPTVVWPTVTFNGQTITGNNGVYTLMSNGVLKGGNLDLSIAGKEWKADNTLAPGTDVTLNGSGAFAVSAGNVRYDGATITLTIAEDLNSAKLSMTGNAVTLKWQGQCHGSWGTLEDFTYDAATETYTLNNTIPSFNNGPDSQGYGVLRYLGDSNQGTFMGRDSQSVPDMAAELNATVKLSTNKKGNAKFAGDFENAKFTFKFDEGSNSCGTLTLIAGTPKATTPEPIVCNDLYLVNAWTENLKFDYDQATDTYTLKLDELAQRDGWAFHLLHGTSHLYCPDGTVINSDNEFKYVFANNQGANVVCSKTLNYVTLTFKFDENSSSKGTLTGTPNSYSPEPTTAVYILNGGNFGWLADGAEPDTKQTFSTTDGKTYTLTVEGFANGHSGFKLRNQTLYTTAAKGDKYKAWWSASKTIDFGADAVALNNNNSSENTKLSNDFDLTKPVTFTLTIDGDTHKLKVTGTKKIVSPKVYIQVGETKTEIPSTANLVYEGTIPELSGEFKFYVGDEDYCTNGNLEYKIGETEGVLFNIETGKMSVAGGKIYKNVKVYIAAAADYNNFHLKFTEGEEFTPEAVEKIYLVNDPTGGKDLTVKENTPEFKLVNDVWTVSVPSMNKDFGVVVKTNKGQYFLANPNNNTNVNALPLNEAVTISDPANNNNCYTGSEWINNTFTLTFPEAENFKKATITRTAGYENKHVYFYGSMSDWKNGAEFTTEDGTTYTATLPILNGSFGIQVTDKGFWASKNTLTTESTDIQIKLNPGNDNNLSVEGTLENVVMTIVFDWASNKAKVSLSQGETIYQEPELAEGLVRVYFDNLDNWSNVSCYAFRDDNTKNADWPGEACELVTVADADGNRNLYYCDLDVEGKKYVRVIFNDGKKDNATQTADELIVANGIYYPTLAAGEAPEYCVSDGNVIRNYAHLETPMTFYFRPDNYDGDVYVTVKGGFGGQYVKSEKMHRITIGTETLYVYNTRAINGIECGDFLFNKTYDESLNSSDLVFTEGVNPFLGLTTFTDDDHAAGTKAQTTDKREFTYSLLNNYIVFDAKTKTSNTNVAFTDLNISNPESHANLVGSIVEKADNASNSSTVPMKYDENSGLYTATVAANGEGTFHVVTNTSLQHGVMTDNDHHELKTSAVIDVEATAGHKPLKIADQRSYIVTYDPRANMVTTDWFAMESGLKFGTVNKIDPNAESTEIGISYEPAFEGEMDNVKYTITPVFDASGYNKAAYNYNPQVTAGTLDTETHSLKLTVTGATIGGQYKVVAAYRNSDGQWKDGTESTVISVLPDLSKLGLGINGTAFEFNNGEYRFASDAEVYFNTTDENAFMSKKHAQISFAYDVNAGYIFVWYKAIATNGDLTGEQSYRPAARVAASSPTEEQYNAELNANQGLVSDGYTLYGAHGIDLSTNQRYRFIVSQNGVQTAPSTFDASLSDGQIVGVDGIEAPEEEAPVFFNLQGVRVAQPESGIYIMVKGGKSTKVIF